MFETKKKKKVEFIVGKSCSERKDLSFLPDCPIFSLFSSPYNKKM